MADWILETGLYLLGVAIIPALGLLLVCWGLWGDRSKGRPRCPKCWYDLRGSLPRCECPECGHEARSEAALFRTRRRWRAVRVGLVLPMLSGVACLIWYGQVPLAIVLTFLAGLALVASGLLGDRSEGRPRCPRCWSHMGAALPQLVCPTCGHDARERRRLYRNRRSWRRITLGLIALVGAGSPWLYQYHVEAEFRAFMRARVPGEQFKVRQSRCLGTTSRRIRLWPILKSKLTGSYPYLSRIGDPQERSFMQVAYFHGYWFNYCKLVRLERGKFTVYWSLKEDRWHVLR